jgi:Holliday junction DNA helicase RuvA
MRNMIVTLSGEVSEKLGEVIVLLVRGVGFGVLVTNEDYGHLAVGDPTKLYIHEHIRENSHDLFGFSQLDTKQLFEQLLEVNGIGPKGALNILSIGSSADVRQAIANGDTKFITAAPGVGKRVAERLVVELKDKVGLVAGQGADTVLIGNQVASSDEAVQALVSLGYSVGDAASVLSSIDNTLPTEERVKQALKGSAL